MQTEEIPVEEIPPEPPPSQETDNDWLHDIIATVQEQKINSLQYCVPTSPPVPHALKDIDFSRIQPCMCTSNCKQHYTFKDPPKLPVKEPQPTPADTILHDDLDILAHHIDIPPTIHKAKRMQILKGQNDIGANTSVTIDKDALILYQDIPPLVIGGVNKEDPAITCTGKGYLQWRAQNGNSLLVPTYYCEQADGTIISPHSI